jgi:hypothetical protein
VRLTTFSLAAAVMQEQAAAVVVDRHDIAHGGATPRRKGYRPAVVKLFVLDELYAVVRCDPDAPVPDWANDGHFWSVTRSDSELSVVCREDDVPADASAERGWCALELAGPLDFSLTGVVSALVVPLADAEVPIFVLSTFETDYLLVREHDLHRSVEALTRAGHEVDS